MSSMTAFDDSEWKPFAEVHRRFGGDGAWVVFRR